MKIEVDPQETTRAEAFSLWMTSPMPMVTLTKTFNVTKLLKASKRRRIKFNALLYWCIGRAGMRSALCRLHRRQAGVYGCDIGD